jgi:VRR-NUC domain
MPSPRTNRKHFDEIVHHIDDADDLLWLFNHWLSYSEELRQYLWAHRDKDVDRARRLVELPPPRALFRGLRYLVNDYWSHLGWLDLLLYRNQTVEFVEVKSSGDKLNAKRKRWIADNSDFLHFPFRLLKLHRAPASR